MTSLQEKRHRETMTSIARATAQRDEALASLIRKENWLRKLQKLEARQRKLLGKPKPEAKPVKFDAAADLRQQVAEVMGHAPQIDTAIPAGLDRNSAAWKERDAADRKKVEEEIAERKRVRAAALAAKRKAAASGETRKMPLTGKAALAHIRGQ